MNKPGEDNKQAVRVGMVSLGCPKNQVDAEILLHLLQKGGYELCGDAALADVVVINTCGFIEDAKQESIDTILEFSQLKKEGRIRCIVVTGCLAERYRDEIAKEIPEADVVLGIGSNREIASAIEQALQGQKVYRYGKKEDIILNEGRVLSTLPFYAYLKIADGCDNCCSYCAIPLIRGRFVSRSMEEIIAEADLLAAAGVKELVVVAQDTTRYGQDLYGKLMLPQLLEKLCEIDGIKWIRILYCYPERITDELLDVMARNEKIVKYIDIPMQHCNGDILQAMNRKGNRQQLLDLIAKIREKMPDMVLRSTFIAGFPGESQEQFEELLSFAKEVHFERLGCFAYSPEEDTKAAVMPGQIDEEEKQHRCDLIMQQQYDIMYSFNQSFIGKTLEVVVEGYDRYGECYFGRSSMDAPDIDGKIFFTAEKGKNRIGDFVQVQIEEVLDYDLMGRQV